MCALINFTHVFKYPWSFSISHSICAITARRYVLLLLLFASWPTHARFKYLYIQSNRSKTINYDTINECLRFKQWSGYTCSQDKKKTTTGRGRQLKPDGKWQNEPFYMQRNISVLFPLTYEREWSFYCRMKLSRNKILCFSTLNFINLECAYYPLV